MTKNNIALIVAAGIGSRSGLDIPKQYFTYQNKTILEHTISCFLDYDNIDFICVIIHEDHKELYHDAISSLCNHPKMLPVTIGGETRQDSVLAGLQAIKDLNVNKVFIHDAARPFLSHMTLQTLFEKLQNYDGAAPALAITDSLRFMQNDVFTNAQSRENLFSVQTPQAFDFHKIYHAHLKASSHHTDDIAVALESELKITYVNGTKENIKMTLAEDFKNAPHPFPDIRTGSGYDVHRLIAGDHVILGGIKISCPYALKGHSDADVLLHAITDAVLGSASENDIGYHFPPTESKWENVDSSEFLKYALDLLRKKNGYINHIDCTLICERPKIGPYRDLIRDNIAKICNLPKDRVNIKATTTEKLGFTGRKEGIAAEAIVTALFSK